MQFMLVLVSSMLICSAADVVAPVHNCPCSSEEAVVSHIVGLAGKQVQLAINGDDVSITEAQAGAAADSSAAYAASIPAGATSNGHAKQQLVASGSWDGSSWALTADQFAPGVVGAKAMSAQKLALAAAGTKSKAAASLNGSSKSSSSNGSKSGGGFFEALLRRGGNAATVEAVQADTDILQLPAWLKVPPSVALPHGGFEAVLQDPVNAGVAGQLQQLLAQVAAAEEAAANNGGSGGASDADLRQIR
jgi:hypothetical protein